MEIPKWLWFVITGIAVFYLMGGSTDDIGLSQESSPTGSLAVVEITAAAQTGGVTDNSIAGSNNFRFIIEDGDLNSENITENINATFTTTIVEGVRSTDGTFLNHNLVYSFTSFDYKNVDDLTDVTLYKTVEWTSNDAKWDVTIDGVDNAGVSTASDSITVGTPGSALIQIDVEDYTTLDKLVENDFAEILIGTMEIKLDGTIVGTADWYYMQD